MVKQKLDAIAKAEKKLRAEFNAMGEDVFTDYVGQFWGYHETRPYMRCRHSHFLTLSSIGTDLALREALVQGRDMLRLCRGDNLGNRDLMVPIFLRLNSYQGMQDCYDFFKWWDTCDPTGNYDWGDVTLPYLNVVGADMLEAPYPELLHKYGNLNHSVAATVIKMRLLLQVNTFLSNLDHLFLSTAARTSFMTHFRGNEGVLGTVVTFLRPAYLCFENKTVAQLRVMQATLRQHVQTLLEVAETHHNERIWKALANPALVLRTPPPSSYSKGSAEETVLVATSFLECFHANTAEARDLLRMLQERVGEKPEYDLPQMQYRY